MPDSATSRRSFLDALLFTSLAATALAAASPVPFFLRPPRGDRARRVRVGRVDEFAPGSARKFRYGGRVGIAIHDGHDLRVLDARCTHQGCVVNWNAEARRLECPCHGAAFAPSGQPVQGPHNGPLAAIPFRITSSGDLEAGE